MRIHRLTIATLAVVALAVLGASAKEIIFRPAPAPVQPPAGQKVITPALAADPAEPPMSVEVAYSNNGNNELILAGGRGGIVRGGRGGMGRAAAQQVKIASSGRGTELTLETPGAWTGSASLTFKNAAPPMRMTMKLNRMPNYDLQSLSLTSGSLTLQVGRVNTSTTTKYFDAQGKAIENSEKAAYTVQARRYTNGQVELQLRRAAGATLAKSFKVDWTSDLNNGMFLEGRGRARLIIND